MPGSIKRRRLAQRAGPPFAIVLLLMAYGMAETLYEDFPLPDVEDNRELRHLNR